MYLRTDIGLPHYVRLVIHPSEDAAALLVDSGIEVNTPNKLQHGSNMRQFPMKRNKGKNDIHFGLAINISSLSALDAFISAFQGT